MEKIGIVTVYKNTNYGSKLQSYALQRTIRSLGYIPENIIVKTKKNGTICRRFRDLVREPGIILEQIHKKCLKRKELKIRKDMFDKYLFEYIAESKFSADDIATENNENKYYKYICGSDQIWAPNQFNECFFLSFVKVKTKKIAYAPSIGLPTIPEHLISTYRDLINDIGFLSIREKDGARLVKEITGREADIVVDPTLC